MKRFRPLILLFPLAIPFPIACWVFTGVRGPLWFGAHQSLALALFAAQAALMAFVWHLLSSIGQVHKYVNPGNQQVDLASMWKDHYPLKDAALSALLMTWVHLAISGMPMVAEHYRQAATIWYDATLWGVEQPLFEAIRTSLPVRMPMLLWEIIYDVMWTYVTGVLVALVIAKRDRAAVEMATASVIMFYVSHLIALRFPTAGPALYRPEYFPYLNGSLSLSLQKFLTSYQDGRIVQNGLLYGVVAMPSMHVALTCLAAFYHVSLSRRAWPAWLWLAATWISTIILGWHYALDGLGGILLATIALKMVKPLLNGVQTRLSFLRSVG